MPSPEASSQLVHSRAPVPKLALGTRARGATGGTPPTETHLAPRSQTGVGQRRRIQVDVYVLVAATLGAILLAHILRRIDGFHLLLSTDSYGYYLLSKGIGQSGLFHFSDDTPVTASIVPLFRKRTYGYPLFLALCGLFSSNDVNTLQLVVFETQLFLFLLIAYYSSRTIAAALRAQGLTCPLYLCTALNPWLLVHCSDLLTDLLSAAFIYLNFALLLRTCLGGGTGVTPVAPAEPAKGSHIGLSWKELRLFFVSGLSVMLRPANLILVPATFALWSAAALRRGRKRLLGLPLLLLAFAVPFVPQIVNNYKISGKLKPLILHDVYQETLACGTRYIKCVAGSDAQGLWVLMHKNPFLGPSLPAKDQSPESFRRKHPWDYLLTCATHGLFLFDQGTPYTYLTHPYPWYRWPSSLLGFAFLGVALYGIAVAIRRAWRRGLSDRQTVASMTALLLSAGYGAMYLPVRVESRYGLPFFLLFVLFFVTGLGRLRKLLAQGRYVPVGAFAAMLIAFLSVCAWVSAWLEGFSEIVRIG